MGFLVFFAPAAHADAGRIQVVEENDKFGSHDDRHYTQGLTLTWLPGMLDKESGWNAPYNALASFTPLFNPGGNFDRQYEWTVVGQSIFTPKSFHATAPVANDRPYGAWLYTGVGLLQQNRSETHDSLEHAEILGGVVGPAALGALVQNDFHQFIGVEPFEGWTNQIHNEPGFVLTYERKWRFAAPLGYFAVDAIPEAGVTLGNVFTYGQTGGMLRFGHNIAADYGPNHVRPSLSGTGWFDPSAMTDKFGWYFFIGTQGRAVGHNIFLDGNTYSSSQSVNKKLLVADFMAGASLFWRRRARLDFTLTQRTKEFYGQQGHDDRFGSIGMTVGF